MDEFQGKDNDRSMKIRISLTLMNAKALLSPKLLAVRRRNWLLRQGRQDVGIKCAFQVVPKLQVLEGVVIVSNEDKGRTIRLKPAVNFGCCFFKANFCMVNRLVPERAQNLGSIGMRECC